MTFTIIGAGNVATHLAQRLYENGSQIRQIFSRKLENAKTLAQNVNTCYTNDLMEINSISDVYICAVSDNAIESILQRLPQNLNENAVFLHTAGSVSIEVFRNYCVCRAANNRVSATAIGHYGVLYPLQTFSKKRNIDFSKIPVFIEGNSAETTKKIREIAEMLSAKIYTVTSEQRQKCHLSAVFACNFTNTMYQISEQLLHDANLPFEVLRPLIEESVAKIETLLPHEAQTGPAMRNDIVTMEKHLQMLKNNVNLQQIYSLLSQEIIRHKIKKLY